jgi:hypothetical protein
VHGPNPAHGFGLLAWWPTDGARGSPFASRPTAEAARPASIWPEAKVAYAAHAAGAVGAPPTGHRTWRTRGGVATGGGSGGKMLLGQWYKHKWRTTNLPDKGKTMEALRGRLPMVRGRRRSRLR